MLEALFFLVLVIVVALGCFGLGTTVGTREMQIEAVKNGYAEWVTSVTGVTTFTWKCDLDKVKIL